jgi:hypothetical protein
VFVFGRVLAKATGTFKVFVGGVELAGANVAQSASANQEFPISFVCPPGQKYTFEGTELEDVRVSYLPL